MQNKVSFSSIYTKPNPTPIPPSHSIHLTTPHSRARRSVASRNRVVNVKLNALVIRLVRTRESDLGSRRSIATILNLQLRTRDVELRTTDRRRRVHSNVLNAHEVFARRERFRECDVDFLFAYGMIMLVGYSLEGERGGGVPFEGQFICPPEKVAPWLKILNHTSPLPSQVAAVLPSGTLAR